MKTAQVVPGVHSLRDGFTHAYLIEGDDGLTMIDTGTPKLREEFATALSTLGRQAGEIKDILVTHHHPDHIGSLAEIVRRTGATVWVGAADAPITRGERAWVVPRPDHVFVRMLGKLMRIGAEKAEPTAVDHELTGDQRLEIAGGISIVETPGHTSGHVSYLLERDRGVLFAGDAAVNIGGIRAVAPILGSLVIEDPDAARRSLRRLAGLDFETAVFGHGNPIPTGASGRFKRSVGMD